MSTPRYNTTHAQFLIHKDINTLTELDTFSTACYSTIVTLNYHQFPMSYYNIAGTQKAYRITLNLSVDSDFNPHQIDWAKVLELDGDYEDVSVYVEDLN